VGRLRSSDVGRLRSSDVGRCVMSDCGLSEIEGSLEGSVGGGRWRLKYS